MILTRRTTAKLAAASVIAVALPFNRDAVAEELLALTKATKQPWQGLHLIAKRRAQLLEAQSDSLAARKALAAANRILSQA